VTLQGYVADEVSTKGPGMLGVQLLRSPDVAERLASEAPPVGLDTVDTQSARRERDYRMRRLLVAADTLALLVGIMSWLLLATPNSRAHALWALLAIPAWVLLFNAYGLYAAGLRRVGYTTVDDIPAMAHAFLAGSVAMWLYFQVTPVAKLRFTDLLVFDLTAFVLALLFRIAIRNVALRRLGMERVMFVGSGPMTPILVRQMFQQPRHGLEPLAALTQPENDRWPLPLPSVGSLCEVDPAAVLRSYGVDRVIISAEGIEDESLLELVSLCRQMGIKISTLPSLSAMMGSAATIDHLEGITLIGINTPSLARSNRLLKRAMDIAGAAFLLLVTAPVWIFAAIAIKLDSSGPVLFRQQRIGRRGRPFRLTKFRSMVVDAEARRAALLAQSRQDNWLDLEHDPRVTRVGGFLRLSSLDELPQLWNVLRGDMSLVGPRPLIAEEDRNVSGWARGRLDLTPGITGVWQVLGRAQIPFEQMIMIDYLYVANWSLWTDVKLILQTVPVVLTRRGAN
jgi:exopolysaccharide biosynthesis polyprenyl glycosylphosphotransferase